MSPLVFKPNNLQLIRRSTLPYTAFERADNFPSNECIYTRLPFQIASSQTANQKSSGFCVFRFKTNFDEREHFVLSFPRFLQIRLRHESRDKYVIHISKTAFQNYAILKRRITMWALWGSRTSHVVNDPPLSHWGATYWYVKWISSQTVSC